MFKAKVQLLDSPIWGCVVPIPNEISQPIVEAHGKRIVCQINGKIAYQCALMPDGNGGYFVLLNKDNRKKLGVDIGDEIELSIQPDESKYGLPMPEEFEEFLLQDPELDRLFHDLTPGKQRALLHQIGSPKRAETRMKKAVVVAEYLKVNNGQLDFKALNQAYKDWNSFEG